MSCKTAPAYHGCGRLERVAGRSILLDSRSESRAIDKSMKPAGEDNEAFETAGNALFICWQARSSVILGQTSGTSSECARSDGRQEGRMATKFTRCLHAEPVRALKSTKDGELCWDRGQEPHMEG